MRDYGGEIRERRLKRKWTLQKFSELTGYPVSKISKIENNLQPLKIDEWDELNEILQAEKVATIYINDNYRPARLLQPN